MSFFNGSKARDCFSCTVLIPDCIWESNLQERFGTFFASHKKVSWLLQCPLVLTAHSLQTQLSQRLYSLTEPKVHSQPLYVLARETTGCVTDFCWHTPWLIAMPRKNPALCDLCIRTSCFTYRPIRWHSQRNRSIPRLFAFRRAATVIAMKYCNHFR